METAPNSSTAYNLGLDLPLTVCPPIVLMAVIKTLGDAYAAIHPDAPPVLPLDEGAREHLDTKHDLP
jgi:hypothetical protein